MQNQRQVSQTALQAMLAERTGEQFLRLITIEHGQLPNPLRFVNDRRNLEREVSGGAEFSDPSEDDDEQFGADEAQFSNTPDEVQTFLAYPFTITTVPDVSDEVPEVQLEIDNVSQDIIVEARRIPTPLQLTLEVVLRSSPLTREVGPYKLWLKNLRFNAATITGTLGFRANLLANQFPKRRFLPSNAES